MKPQCEKAVDWKCNRAVAKAPVALLLASMGGCDSGEPYAARGAKTVVESYLRATVKLVNDCNRTNVSSEIAIAALFQDPGWPGWQGPYMTAVRPGIDDFGNAIQVIVSNATVEVSSAGPDRRLHTDDDIVAKLTATVVLGQPSRDN